MSDEGVGRTIKRSSGLLPVCSNHGYSSDDRKRNTDGGHVHPALDFIIRTGYRMYFMRKRRKGM
jgi:hypothetical protein